MQIALPLRQHFIQDNVLWSEEGHRLSWRMMLRTKSGSTQFIVVDKGTGERTTINKGDHLSKKQFRTVSTKPDAIWQFAQHLKRFYAAQGKDIAVYVKSRIRINGRSYQKFIDPEVDIAAVPWNYFGHSEWLLDSGDYLEKE